MVRPLVIDNGGAYVRIGFAGPTNPKSIRVNAIARGKKDKKIYVGEKISSCPAYALSRPVNRGLVEDWELQKVVWQQSKLLADPSNVVVATVCPFAPAMAKKDMYEVLFRDLGFEKCLVIESSLAAQFSMGITSQFTADDWLNPCGLLIDMGFSHCSLIPVFNTQPIPGASVRFPVGGRVLNNILRERLAYSQVDLDDNPLLVQHIRESVCQVLPKDIKLQKSSESTTYVLPDFASNNFGHVDNEAPNMTASVRVAADRFAVPETLFNPSCFGIDRLGIVECVQLAISKCPSVVREAVGKKIIVFGGLAMTPGLLPRLAEELNARLLVEADGRLDLSVWRGAATFNDDDLTALGAIAKQDWD